MKESEEIPRWTFRYKCYKKQKAIQLKPFHDKGNHFSIIWGEKRAISDKQFASIDSEIRDFIIQNFGCVLTFTIIRVCTNCTYGRFDQDFEKLILSLREKHKNFVSRKKDLPLSDPKHIDLHDKILWDESHPIIHHIHGRSQTNDKQMDKEWEKLFHGPLTQAEPPTGNINDVLFNTKVKIDIIFDEKDD